MAQRGLKLNDRRDLHRWIHETGDLTGPQRTRSPGVLELPTRPVGFARPTTRNDLPHRTEKGVFVAIFVKCARHFHVRAEQPSGKGPYFGVLVSDPDDFASFEDAAARIAGNAELVRHLVEMGFLAASQGEFGQRGVGKRSMERYLSGADETTGRRSRRTLGALVEAVLDYFPWW